MRKLERKYDREMVVIGVHSPKFITERETESVRQAILRLNVGHPVVNDSEFTVWRSYAVRAWPTLMFIDPEGRVIGKHEGEFETETFDRLIGTMVAELDAEGRLDRRPLTISGDRAIADGPLRFPGKLLADVDRGLLAISDTGHNRVILAHLDGTVRQVIGSGQPGLADGPASEAQLDMPQGLALHGNTLYVADTENHALRVVDLQTGNVATFAGTGVQLMGPRVGGALLQTRLSSPWDLTIANGVLYVAMAGTHQIWATSLGSGDIQPHTGDGREALVDGPRLAAAMNQPSGITTDGTALYVADSEASAIRHIDPAADGQITTIVGEGLFEFGDRDGIGPAQVRLQHPIGVAWHQGVLYIADTYNHRIKRLDPSTGECRAFAGQGLPGDTDGPAATARFSEPSGLAVAGDSLYVADTNNHVIRAVSLGGEPTVSTLPLRGL
ncbi:MAG: alkyl hydroperoxide reductase [Chloroflexota bacterium]